MRFFGSSILLRWFQLTSRYVEYTAFLEQDGRAAGVRQQPVHLGLEPVSKDVPRVVRSVGQISVGCAGFTVDLEREICGSRRAYNGNVEVEASPDGAEAGRFGWVDSVLS